MTRKKAVKSTGKTYYIAVGHVDGSFYAGSPALKKDDSIHNLDCVIEEHDGGYDDYQETIVLLEVKLNTPKKEKRDFPIIKLCGAKK